MTIIDNFLDVGELAGGEEQTGWLQPHPGGLLEGAEGSGKNEAAADFAEAIRQW